MRRDWKDTEAVLRRDGGVLRKYEGGLRRDGGRTEES